jgi:hypothetical protein
MSAAISGPGLFGDNSMDPMRNAPPVMIAPIGLGGAPMVMGLAGFGAGMGAFIRNQGRDADRAQGLVIIRCGLNPVGTGVLQLNFPQAIVTGQYVVLADWATFSLTVASPTLQANWTATRPLLSQETLVAAYQWTVST